MQNFEKNKDLATGRSDTRVVVETLFILFLVRLNRKYVGRGRESVHRTKYCEDDKVGKDVKI